MSRSIRAMGWLAVLMASSQARLLYTQAEEKLESRGYVSDFANVLDAQSIQSIRDLSYCLEYWTGTQLSVVTVSSLEHATVETYTARLFGQWSADPGPTDLGVLILLAPQEHRYRIQVAPRLQPILSDRIAKFEQEAIPYVGRRQYGPAMTLMARRVAAAIAEDAHVGLKEPSDGYLGKWSPTVQPYDAFMGSITAMAVAGLFVVFIVVTVKAVSRRCRVNTSLL